MKKTLYGKRHIRARRSVAIGRGNKMAHKLMRGTNALFAAIKAFEPDKVLLAFSKAIEEVNKSLAEIGRIPKDMIY